MIGNWQWRSYQIDCFESIISAFRKGIANQLIVQATGTGKRSAAVYMAGKAKNSLFLAHTEELIGQAYDEFCKWYGKENVGLIRGDKMELDKRFVISSPQTLINRLHLIPRDHFSLLQLDEVHHYLAKTFYTVVNHFIVKMRLGWTATPNRLDGLSLMDIFDEVVFEYGLLDGIRDGHLAELDGIRIRTNTDLSKARKRMGDFAIDDLCSLVDTPQRNQLVAATYLSKAKGRPFLGFCVNTKHLVHLGETMQDNGIKVGLISFDKNVCPDREGTIALFEKGELNGLLNVMILTEGYDYDDIGCILEAAPTMSHGKFTQIVGRGARLKSKEFKALFGNNCKVIDFVDITGKHKIVNTYELDKYSPAVDKIFVTSENREKITEAERSRSASKVMGETTEDAYINLAKPAKIQISKSKKMMEEATSGQIKLLTSFGIYERLDNEGNEIFYTKKMVSELINSTEITDYQKQCMIGWGYNPTGAVLSQYLAIARKIKTENENKQREKELSRQRAELYKSVATD